MIKLRIMNETGHTEVMLDASSIIEQIDNTPYPLVLFIDGEMVAEKKLAKSTGMNVTSVDLTPAIVGGKD